MTDEILEGEELQSLEQDEQALAEQAEEQTIDQMEDEDAPKQVLTDEELDLVASVICERTQNRHEERHHERGDRLGIGPCGN